MGASDDASMSYVIMRTDGVYVARSGSASSYTPYLQRARVFTTREAAERERCPGNERVVSIEAALGGG